MLWDRMVSVFFSTKISGFREGWGQELEKRKQAEIRVKQAEFRKDVKREKNEIVFKINMYAKDVVPFKS